MPLTLHDSTGSLVAYCDSDGSIYFFSGEPIAYLDGDSVYRFSGRHLGWFLDGWVLDHYGNAVFFSEQSTGGPLKPVPQLAPLRGLKGLKPLKGLRELKPLRPPKTLSWSELSSEDFFAE